MLSASPPLEPHTGNAGLFIYSIDEAVLDLLPEIQFQHGRLVGWARKVVLTKALAENVGQASELGNFAIHLAESKYREVAK